jgi:molybdate transport system permease protein
MNALLNPLFLTFKLAFCTAVALLCIGMPVAYAIAYRRGFVKTMLSSIVSMPLVLPPTVLGFYLLLIFGPATASGRFLIDTLHVKLLFTFWGLVAGSIICSFPFMVNPLISGFESVPRSLIEAAATLGKTRLQTLVHVLLPNMKGAILTGAILSFSHAIGEFGVVLMIGGKIPAVTRVASIAIYDEVESLNYPTAHFYAGVLFAVSFLVLLTVYTLNRRFVKPL